MLNIKNLEKCLDNGFNVLLEGSHGLGKTAIIKAVFESRNLRWKYFSASTMDPWIDFIGVPKTVLRNGKDVLELIKPKEFENDEIEAIFFDEFNRAPPKVINAVMELIQFKSINGKKFNNLKVVWAAINPYDEEGTYSVEQLDPATRDRFHIQIKIPLELDTSYLIKTHGELSRPFIKWWGELPKELKMQVSPRRLDYAIQVHNAGCDLRDVLVPTSNVKKLEDYIKEMNRGLEIMDLLQKTDKELQTFFTLENTIRYGQQIVESKKFIHLLKYFHKDFVESNIQKKNGSNIKNKLIKEAIDNTNFYQSLESASKKIVDDARTSGGIIKSVHVDYTMEKIIHKTVEDNVGKSARLFVTKLTPVFNTFCASLKGHKSTDIVSFFDLLFGAKDTQNNDLQNDIFSTLANYKTISTYKPTTDSQKLFMGMLLNFAIKFAKQNQHPATNQLQSALTKIYAVGVKYMSNPRKRISKLDWGQFIIVGFEEDNWELIKDTIAKKNDWDGVAGSLKVKAISNGFKARDSKTMKFKTPASIDKARETFSKDNLNVIKKTNTALVNLDKANVRV